MWIQLKSVPSKNPFRVLVHIRNTDYPLLALAPCPSIKANMLILLGFKPGDVAISKTHVQKSCYLCC